MFELPEYVTLARQMNDTLKGKTIQRGQLGNSPHKFVWYNRTHEEFEGLTRGKTSGKHGKGSGCLSRSNPDTCCCWESAVARCFFTHRGPSFPRSIICTSHSRMTRSSP